MTLQLFGFGLALIENMRKYCKNYSQKNDIMLTKEKIAEILREKYPYLIAKYGVKSLGLFGSYARGEQTEDSDVDLVAEFERPIGLNFIEFAEYIENILGKKADILTPEGVRRITVQKIARNIEQSIIYV